MNKKLLVLFLALFIANTLFAQCSNWLEASGTLSEGFGTVATDINNNVYSSGSFFDTISFSTDTLITNASSYGEGFYINKFNPNGVLQWALMMETNSLSAPVIYQENGYLYIVGSFSDSLITNVTTDSKIILAGSNTFLMKMDLSGNIIWTKTYDGASISSIVVNNLNQVYFAGTFSGSTTFGSTTLTVPDQNSDFPGASDAFIVKTDSTGNAMWAIQSTSDDQYSLLNGFYITVDNNYNVLLTGNCDSLITFGSTTFNANTTTTFDENSNPYLAKFDSSGNCLWIVGGQGSSAFYSGLFDVVADSQNNVYFAATIGTDVITYNGQTISPSNGELYYCKYSPSGNPIWIKQVAGTAGAGGPTALAIDASNHVWMSGATVLPASFGSYSVPGHSVFMTEFDTSGAFLNAVACTWGSKGNCAPKSLVIDSNGDLCVGCYDVADTLTYEGITTALPTDDSLKGANVILKYCTATAGIPQLIVNSTQLSIYPNPTNGLITITSTKNIDGIIVTNLLGQVELKSPSGDLGVTEQEINLSSFPTGMYFITVTSGDENTTGKIIVSK